MASEVSDISDDFKIISNDPECGDSSFYLNSQVISESEQSSDIDFVEDEEVEYLCSVFSKKFNVRVKGISDILQYLETSPNMTNSEAQKQMGKLQKKNEKQRNLIVDLQKQMSAYEAKSINDNDKIDYINHQLAIVSDERDQLKIQLSEANRKISLLQQSVKNEQESKKQIESTMSSMSSMLEGQISDINKLTEQRNSLIATVSKQGLIIDQFEKIIQEKPTQTQIVVDTRKEKDIGYSDVIAVLYRSIIDSVSPKLGSRLYDIKESTSLTAENKLQMIMQEITKYIASVESDCIMIEKEKERLSQLNNSHVEKNSKILSLLEEQLIFMQKLINSDDIQSCVFFRNPGQNYLLNPEAKEELIRYTAKVGRYVEDFVPDYPTVGLLESMSEYDESVRTEIFSFLSANVFEQKLQAYLQRTPSIDDPDSRFMFCLFASQALMNEILQNRAVEIRNRFDVIHRQNKQLKNQLSSEIEVNNDLKAEVERLIVQITHISQIASEQEHTENNEDLCKQLEEQRNNIKRLTEENENLKQKHAVEAEELKKNLTVSDGEIKSCQNTIAQLNKDFLSAKEEISRLQNENNKLQVSIEQLNKTLEDTQDKMAEKQAIEEDTNTKTEELISIIEKLQYRRKKLKDRVKYLETVNIKSVDSLNEKSKMLRSQYESSLESLQSQLETLKRTVNEMNIKIDDLEAENQSLTSQNQSIRMEKMSLDIRIKTSEERLENTRLTLENKYKAQYDLFSAQLKEKHNSLLQKQSEKISTFIAKMSSTPFSFPTVSKIDFDQFMTILEEELNRRVRSQTVYEDTLADIIRVQKALGITNCGDMYDRVSDLLSESAKLRERLSISETQTKEATVKADSLIKEIRRVEDQLISLKQWEMWARRVHRVVFEANSSTYSNEQLRISLEEALLLSVNNRGVLDKLTSLREQKKALKRKDVRDTDTLKPNGKVFKSLIIVARACRRFGMISGHYPIDDHMPSYTYRTPISPNTPQRTKKSHPSPFRIV